MKTLERKKTRIQGRTPDNFALIDDFCIGFAGNSTMEKIKIYIYMNTLFD